MNGHLEREFQKTLFHRPPLKFNFNDFRPWNFENRSTGSEISHF